MVTPMPTNRAALSLVPNVAIAKSFIQGGVKSMKVDPSANTGVALAVKNAPISSATASTTPADTTPASAAMLSVPLVRDPSFFMQLIRSGPGLGWVDECRVTGRTRQLPL
ncbi:hypothetical protein PJL18_04280 [Paenarthrobacter nicotinovorans]|nr:hypothetical protein [Paenarthrobacter nicotinovorans]